jgi:hypothetical protein
MKVYCYFSAESRDCAFVAFCFLTIEAVCHEESVTPKPYILKGVKE